MKIRQEVSKDGTSKAGWRGSGCPTEEAPQRSLSATIYFPFRVSNPHESDLQKSVVSDKRRATARTIPGSGSLYSLPLQEKSPLSFPALEGVLFQPCLFQRRLNKSSPRQPLLQWTTRVWSSTSYLSGGSSTAARKRYTSISCFQKDAEWGVLLPRALARWQRFSLANTDKTVFQKFK